MWILFHKALILQEEFWYWSLLGLKRVKRPWALSLTEPALKSFEYPVFVFLNVFRPIITGEFWAPGGTYHLHGKTGNPGWKIKCMVRAIPFGELKRIYWAVIWSDAIFLLFLVRKRFEPRSYFISWLSMIVRVNVVLNRNVAVDSDWRFDNLCGGYLQSQSF